MINRQARERPTEWWAVQIREILPELKVALDKRNLYVHGWWHDLEQLTPGAGYTVLKPDKTTENWIGQRLPDLHDVLAFTTDLEQLRTQIRAIADRLLDQVMRRSSPS